MKEHCMSPAAGTGYRETEVMTATPQRLQLMLLDAAIRFASQARQHFDQGNNQAAFTPVLRAQQIMAELLTGLNAEPPNGMVRQVASIYLFVYRSLVAANLERNTARLDDALRVLQVERETWRQVCEQLGAENPATAATHVTFSLGASYVA
jgi:flagellar secretion chaperone FliS